MEEQPVALATIMWSPKSCVASLIYGVSPHPEHAPENSKSGCNNCEFLMAPTLRCAEDTSGNERKNSQFAFSFSRNGGCGAMLMALRPTCRLSLAGHASTHRLQPVQSSGETCKEYFISGNSLKCASIERNVSGASFSSAGSYTFMRITACGQTITHLPHCMQRSGSQTGISWAMLRFSHFAVPEG